MGQEFSTPAGCNSPAVGRRVAGGGFQKRLTRNVNIDRNVKEFSRFWGTGIVVRPKRSNKRNRFTKQCSASSYSSRNSRFNYSNGGLTSDDEDVHEGSYSGAHTPSHKYSSQSTSPRAHTHPFSCNSCHPMDHRASVDVPPAQPPGTLFGSSTRPSMDPPTGMEYNNADNVRAYVNHNNPYAQQQLDATSRPHPAISRNKQLWLQTAGAAAGSANNLLCPSPPCNVNYSNKISAPGRMNSHTARLVKQRSLSPSPSYRVATECGLLPVAMDVTPPTSCHSSYSRLPSPSPTSLQPSPSPPNALISARHLRHQVTLQQDSPASSSPHMLSLGNSFDIDGEIMPESYSPRQRMYSNASNHSSTRGAPVPYHINEMSPEPNFEPYMPPPAQMMAPGHRRHVFATKGRFLTVDVHTAD